MDIISNWLNKETSLYRSYSDNTGSPATFLDVLYFAKNTETIKKIRELDINAADYKIKSVGLKSKLSCYTPAALLKSKASGKVTVVERTGIMQLDFDSNAVKGYNLEELKQAIIKLPFIGYCGLSCSGHGIFALALIAEPEKLSDYAEHCFSVFKQYGLQPDESKGKKVENLRYVSYDPNRLIRRNPKPLQIKHFKAQEKQGKKSYACKTSSVKIDSPDALIRKHLKALEEVQQGERWPTVQRAAFTLGGLGDPELLEKVREAILNNDSFSGEEEKYLSCAENRFEAGSKELLITPTNPDYWQ
jgi:hypothetical protein